MSKLALIVIGIFLLSSIFFYVRFVPKTTPEQIPVESDIKEEDIVKCETDSDCVVVPYRHCCGSTKKAINKKYKDLYSQKPEWQKFDNPQTCAIIGMCPNDRDINTAKCNSGTNYKYCGLYN